MSAADREASREEGLKVEFEGEGVYLKVRRNVWILTSVYLN